MNANTGERMRARTLALLRRRPELGVGLALLVLLIATSSGYGWHRDELYFRVAGQHPALGYPDQPLLTPLVVAAAAAIGHQTLVVVRLVSAIASVATAVLTGALAGEMGGGPRARLIGSACWAVGGFSVVSGHFVDTSTFDVLAATGACLCLARAVRRDDPRWLVAAGVVVGLGALNKLLVGFVAVFLLLGLALVGPRSPLRPRPLLLAVLAAVLGAAPYLGWQAAHGWPQLDLARSIAADGAEGGRVGVIPFQLVLVAPPLLAVWVAGLVRLLRNQAARPYRFLAIAYLLFTAFVIVTGGKSYYVGGLLTSLVAAGALATDAWLDRGRRRLRRRLLVTAVALSLLVNALIGLDILPPRALNGPVIALNPDSAEQVGWPRFTDAIATAWHAIPTTGRTNAVIFTENYGEAGAIDLYGPARGLPPAYSGHNAFGSWGPPPDRAGPVVVVGYAADTWLAQWFRGCRRVATVDDGYGLDNDEQGDVVQLCAGTTRPWSALWPHLRHDD